MKKALCAGLLTVLTACGAGAEPRMNLEGLAEHVKVFRRTLYAENAAGEQLSVSDSYGTAYLHRSLLSSYYVTNAHVAGAPIPAPPEGYSLTGVSYSLVDDVEDAITADDLFLTPLFLDEPHDLAVLVAEGPTLKPRTRICTPSLGDTVVSMGYHSGVLFVAEECYITNTNVIMDGQQKLLASCDTSHGMSGSPVYGLDDGKTCLYGVVQATTTDYNHAFLIPGGVVDAVVDEAVKNGEGFLPGIPVVRPEITILAAEDPAAEDADLRFLPEKKGWPR